MCWPSPCCNLRAPTPPGQGGHVATVRDSRGDEEMAACGQLGVLPEALASGSERRPPRLMPPPERLRGVIQLV